MATEIRTKQDARAAFTITLNALAAGAARQSNMLANSLFRPAALVYVQLKTHTVAATAGMVHEVYLLRSDVVGGGSLHRTDGAGASDAAMPAGTPLNAPLLGTIAVSAATSTLFYGEFDTAALGPLGAEWGIAIKNATDQPLFASTAHVAAYVYYVPEIQ